MTDLDSSQLFKVMQRLKTGQHGSFMAHIAEAYLVADWRNQAKLLEAYDDIFEGVYRDIRRSERTLVKESAMFKAQVIA
jgi:hypothetical protein